MLENFFLLSKNQKSYIYDGYFCLSLYIVGSCAYKCSTIRCVLVKSFALAEDKNPRKSRRKREKIVCRNSNPKRLLKFKSKYWINFTGKTRSSVKRKLGPLFDINSRACLNSFPLKIWEQCQSQMFWLPDQPASRAFPFIKIVTYCECSSRLQRRVRDGISPSSLFFDKFNRRRIANSKRLSIFNLLALAKAKLGIEKLCQLFEVFTG